MSALEDRQDAAPAIVAPAAAMPAPAEAETADLDAVAAVEGVSDDTTAQEQAELDTASPAAPAFRDPDDPASAAGAPTFDLERFEPEDGPDDEAPLLDDALEAGIASVFAALHSAASAEEADESDEPEGPLSEDEAVDGITFRLLGELDRLWHRAA